jgi:hypothetical protein
MRPQKTLFIVTLILLASSSLASAQSKEPGSDSLLARVSYNGGSSLIDRDMQEGYPQSCFALYRNGYYQILRTTKDGTESFQGTLSQHQRLHLGRMLKDLDFDGSRGGVVLQGAERFVAEITREGKTIHYVWMNPDHQHPFPNSAARVIDWLRDFEAEGASPLTLRELSEHPICPPASAKPVQPVVAGLR